MASRHTQTLDQYLFVFTEADEQLLLVLALLSHGRAAHHNPAMTGDQIIAAMEAGRVPEHPSLTEEWPTHGVLVRALGRLRQQGLVTGNHNIDGVRSWNLIRAGYDRLRERMVFDPVPKERR